ncbi:MULTISPECIES: HPr family phosphocarrier protein [unclassified Fusibacter]|uniref:HPr family phosphocarrier protein n=1 Tax=unclassified Fusibacter TaxID=2624464 RepID=UPI00101324C8|nr:MULTISPECIES: HPr family phosphocarrier protein [unclassified Fusibacter]MCK8059376.1 HPr family phosphocarrier protein [Fusibacter sp. A2]NPE21160.1 HPr family phosphocarrier protein [Fusibacter sp. A1]RXV62428.1 HPr family phosphocarrier protein [Fusibacter sp. A1]
MTSKQVTVSSASGLHARPAGLLVSKAKEFEANVEIVKGTKVINAKSIMGILSLGTASGDELTIQADGADEVMAVDSLVELFENVLAHE